MSTSLVVGSPLLSQRRVVLRAIEPPAAESTVKRPRPAIKVLRALSGPDSIHPPHHHRRRRRSRRC
jgi:hypothetical protein